MPRWALGVEYDGALFHGFQRQPHHHGATVQGDLEAALSRIADHEIQLICAGRTDTGVHATGQVIHFDTPAEREPVSWIRGGNTLTSPGIVIHWAVPVAESFHARFSALWRRYVYVMTDAGPVQALLRDRLASVSGTLDAERMSLAAQALPGEQDFSCFRAAGCQARGPVREIQHARVVRAGPVVGLEIQANAFLQHMVRNIVGSLIPIGRGEQSVDWLRELIASRDRTLAGPAAPGAGLYLTQVGYPDEFQLPHAPAGVVMPELLLGI